MYIYPQVNEVELRNKNVNEVCDILAGMTGTLTMLVVPTPAAGEENGKTKPAILHLKVTLFVHQAQEMENG